MPGPFDKEDSLARGPYPLEQSGEGNLWLRTSEALLFHMSRQYIILHLNFSPFTTQRLESSIVKDKELSGALHCSDLKFN